MKACPTSAITKRMKDEIVVDSEKCIGRDECGFKCLKVCPWDSPQFSNEINIQSFLHQKEVNS
ncbi:MAG: hypothetical protein ACTSO6_02750 [Promethearchaeota archaeon]